MDIDKLSGVELNAEVAERLMGIKDVQSQVEPSGNVEYVYDAEPGVRLRVPLYCASPAACAMVERKLKPRWKRIAPRADERPGPGVPTTVVYESLDGKRRVEAAGSSFEEAVCRAALKTL